jgi:hypothetical protein
VQRQYTGTAGRVENAQVAVYLVYAGDAGHAMIDRELYVPRGWIADPDRCRAAGIPEQVGFATKPTLATQMLARTLLTSVRCCCCAWRRDDSAGGGRRAPQDHRRGQGAAAPRRGEPGQAPRPTQPAFSVGFPVSIA